MNISIVKENIINTYNSIRNDSEKSKFKENWNLYVDNLKSLINSKYDEINKLRILDQKNISIIKNEFDLACEEKSSMKNSAYSDIDIDFLSGYNSYLNDIVSILNNEYLRFSYKLKDSLPSKPSVLDQIEFLRLQ